MSTSLPQPEQVEDPVIPPMTTWGEEVTFWAKGKERFRSAIRTMAPKFKARFVSVEEMKACEKEIYLFIARGILTDVEFDEWDRPAVGKSSTKEEKTAAAKLRTTHQKRVYNAFIDLCMDVFGKSPSKSIKKAETVKKEIATPAPVPLPEVVTSIPVPESALPGLMTALRRAGTVNIVHGSLVYNWTTHTYEARNEQSELLDFHILVEGMTDPFAEEDQAEEDQEEKLATVPCTPPRTGTPLLDPEEESLVGSLSALTHEDPPENVCVLCTKPCLLADQVQVDCCAGMFHRVCLHEGFRGKYGTGLVVEVECLHCRAIHPVDWALKLVKE